MLKYFYMNEVNMNQIEITHYSGFVFKRESLEKNSLATEAIAKKLELEVLDQSIDLITFKPCYPDRVQFLVTELKKMNLEYVDDYFVFEIDVPEWLQFSVTINR